MVEIDLFVSTIGQGSRRGFLPVSLLSYFTRISVLGSLHLPD